MFTSDEREKGRQYLSVIRAYVTAAACCALFGAVYECFSHGVYSPFMLCAFLLPLLFGAVPFFLRMKSGRPFPSRAAADCIHGGAAAFTLGSLMRGVLEIYGTASPLLAAYWIIGVLLTAVGWLLAGVMYNT